MGEVSDESMGTSWGTFQLKLEKTLQVLGQQLLLNGSKVTAFQFYANPCFTWQYPSCIAKHIYRYVLVNCDGV